jgi:molecular chaperone GrpE
VSDSGEKGKFSTEISNSVIEEALKSVKRRTGDTAPAPAAAPEAPAPANGDPPVEVEGAAAAEAPQDPKDKELSDLKMQLEFSMAKGRELMEKLKEGHEKMLRSVADLDNYKKRAAKEKEEIQKFGNEKLLKDFLPVIDNFDRAMEHSKSAADFESLKQGLLMTRKLFEDTLGRHGVKPFTSVGKTFDPRFHEAMQQVETTDVPANQVVGEVLRGFTLNDRLVRPALVMVAKPPAPAAPAESKPLAQPVAEGGTGESGSGSGGTNGAGGPA